MPVRYDQDTKAKAIWLMREHACDYLSEYAAITAVARRLGMTPETLRKWKRQAAVDEGRQAPGVQLGGRRAIDMPLAKRLRGLRLPGQADHRPGGSH